MECSEVIELSIRRRRHVVGIGLLNADTVRGKMRLTEKILQCHCNTPTMRRRISTVYGENVVYDSWQCQVTRGRKPQLTLTLTVSYSYTTPTLTILTLTPPLITIITLAPDGVLQSGSGQAGLSSTVKPSLGYGFNAIVIFIRQKRQHSIKRK